MKAIRFKLASLLLALLLLLPLTHASAETFTYDFDRIDVVYASEFTMTASYAASDHWLTMLAGGPDKPIQVMYGVVHLYNGDRYTEEQFIKMTGEGGSERFLSNSIRNDYYDEAGTLKKQTSIQFWSGKKLDGTTVVKDFTEPLKSVTLVQSLSPQGQISGYQLQAQPLIYPGMPLDPFADYVSSYAYNPDSLQHTGEINGKEVEPQPDEPITENPKPDEPIIDQPAPEQPLPEPVKPAAEVTQP
ncbi:hypothetical protein [Paenibacillus montanisoli]|uniref:Uncharacterized protein n=1 Tax=Paenibacillus montanisoli TaxID=2081970 RepID=A0A328U1J4_9BACL|nr:hypothetical protein [Paenibacillus montanisoli]RAP75932.1 hypothetical protein DL346_10905 [Paenibacillus montanisoli]